MNQITINQRNKMLNRRTLITGLISFTVAAPAIVRVESIMPVKKMDLMTLEEFNRLDEINNERLLEAMRIMKERIAANVLNNTRDHAWI